MIPTLTIGIPVYNGEDLLPRTLDNLLDQTFQSFKIIISNNGSIDRSGEIADAYAVKDKRISVIHHSITVDPTRNFQFVLEHADTKYFMWCAHDDFRDQDFIEKLVVALEREPGLVLAFGDVLQYKNGETFQLELDFANSRRSIWQSLFWAAHNPLHHLYGVWVTKKIQSLKWRHTNWWHDTPLMMAACLLGPFVYVPGPRLHYLCNSHPFWNQGFGFDQILRKSGDVVHFIYQCGVTVGNSGGVVKGVFAAICGLSKIMMQTFHFMKKRIVFASCGNPKS